MNAQKKIERWCRDERFMHYTARRMNEEIADVPENWTYDPEFEELDEAFETDDRYAVPLATYLLYRLRVARLHRNVRRRSRAVWRVFIQVAGTIRAGIRCFRPPADGITAGGYDSAARRICEEVERKRE